MTSTRLEHPEHDRQAGHDEHEGHTHSASVTGRGLLVRIGVGVGIVCALFAVRALIPGLAWNLPNRMQDFITLSISVIVESLPFVLLGIVLAVIVQVWLPAGFFDRILPKNPLARRACISLIGMLLPVCECGNVPLARGLIIRGFTVPESLTFLLAAPILNPITIITTQQAFVGGFVIANTIGWLYSRHPAPDALLTPGFVRECAVAHQESGSRLTRSLAMFVRETTGIMPALIIGSLVAGGIQTIVPRDVLVVLGSNPVWSVLALMALAFVVSVCSNVDAFFILSFGGIFSTGAIVSFLTFGPMIDVKMLALMRTTFTTKTLVQVSVLVGLMSAALGLAVNVLV
jgi:uncharacterized membrane protein YraQ (UPF0718 family)